MSVLLRRAATSALVTIAAWLLFTIFSTVLGGLLADAIAPAGDDAGFEEALRNARTEITISQVSPETLYREATLTLLAPDTRSVGIVLPEQADRAVPGVLTLPPEPPARLAADHRASSADHRAVQRRLIKWPSCAKRSALDERRGGSAAHLVVRRRCIRDRSLAAIAEQLLEDLDLALL